MRRRIHVCHRSTKSNAPDTTHEKEMNPETLEEVSASPPAPIDIYTQSLSLYRYILSLYIDIERELFKEFKEFFIRAVNTS